ncbi:hypothetical protein [Natronococcus occultus]|uniref:hypothetical protein n=1 Tax=Natronococcus occultus TaxID=29288 RepID=UPI0006775BC3|nr:hypothetical protein [Natronococcus occultus]
MRGRSVPRVRAGVRWRFPGYDGCDGEDGPNVPSPYREERAGLLERDFSDETIREMFFETALEYLDLEADAVVARD